MFSTIKRLFSRDLPTGEGYGDELALLRSEFDRLAEDYSGFKETMTAFRKRVGMRWARSGGANGEGDEHDLKEMLRQALDARKRYDPFQDL